MSTRNDSEYERELRDLDSAAAFDAIEDQIYVFKLGGEVIYMNRAAKVALPDDKHGKLENIFNIREDMLLFRLNGDPLPFEERPLTKISSGKPAEAMDVMSVHRVSGKTLYRRVEANLIGVDSGLAILHVKDITSQVKSMQAVERARNRFEALFRSGPMATALTSIEEGRFLDVNDMFLSMLGYNRSEVIGRTTSELGMWADRARRLGIVRELRMHGRSVSKEIMCHTASGDAIHVLTSWSLVQFGQEEEDTILTALIDISERKALEQELSRALQNIVEDASGFARSIIGRVTHTPSIEVPAASSQTGLGDELTRREREVLVLAARGANDATIAEQLGISPVTVRNYLSRIYKKLNVHSRTEAVIWAREHDLN